MARRCGLKMTVLRPVAASVTTPERPTSLPVPAVVGMVTMGGTFGPMKRSPPRRVVVVDERPVVGDLERDELARVERRAAADRDDAAARVRLVGGDAVDDVLLDGVRVDAGEDGGRDAALLEQRAHALGDAHLDDARVAHDERARRADALRRGRPRCATAPAPKTIVVGNAQVTRSLMGGGLARVPRADSTRGRASVQMASK